MSKVLDHGYVSLVESWGSDRSIIEAARMSTDKGFLGWGGICPHCSGIRVMAGLSCEYCHGSGQVKGDEGLLRYLWEHKHATPFEMAGMTIEVQAPIFVFREWHRHRTQSYNEMSSRFTVLPNLCYVPSVDRMQASMQAKSNKQSSCVGSMTIAEAERHQAVLRGIYSGCRATYEHLLDAGIAKEVARLCLPVAQYSRMRASANLRNWLAFLTLRMAPNAQYEIRQFANAVGGMIAETFPRTWTLFSKNNS